MLCCYTKIFKIYSRTCKLDLAPRYFKIIIITESNVYFYILYTAIDYNVL
jgi:hypothetical protein